MNFIEEHPILTFFGILAVFIFIMIKSTWSHRIGYIIFLILFLPSNFEKTHEWLYSLIADHSFFEFIYSDVFAWIVLIYAIIGLPEAIMRIFGPVTFREFIWEFIERKIYVWRVLHDEKFGRKEMGADYIDPKMRERAKKATEKKKQKDKNRPFEQNKHLQELMKDLNDMIGLSGVKKEIADIVDLENFQKQREKSGLKRNAVGAGGY